VASHTSAAWLWNMIDRAPDMPEISVNSSSLPLLRGVRVHRSRDLDHSRTILRTGIPTTDPLRTLVDLGTVMAAPDLAPVLHRTLASRLHTPQAVVAELNRLSRQGRPGVKRLRGVVRDCGLVDAPHPSVLEAMTLRVIIDHAYLFRPSRSPQARTASTGWTSRIRSSSSRSRSTATSGTSRLNNCAVITGAATVLSSMAGRRSCSRGWT
jgi:hypothetical protein